jgi:hypothetical protein
LNKPKAGLFSPFGVSTGYGESYVFSAILGNNMMLLISINYIYKIEILSI